MRLREILKGKGQIRIKEYEKYKMSGAIPLALDGG